MKIKELIAKLSQFNPDTEVEFLGIPFDRNGRLNEICSEECLIKEKEDFIQFIISGESLI